MSSPTQPHIVVTGANGFIGTHVMHALAHAGEYPVGLCRKPTKGLVHGFDLENPGDYGQVLKGAKAVVHCAARVQISRSNFRSWLALVESFSASFSAGASSLTAETSSKSL